MNYAKTYFGFLHADCLADFGAEAGAAIFAMANERFQALLASADDRNHGSIRKHMQKNIFPVMAYYFALLEWGFERGEAYERMLKVTQKMAAARREQNQKLAKLPFAYQLFALFCRPVMKWEYPAEGWEIIWVKFDDEEIHLDMKSCLYVDVTTAHGCPELCSVFCKNDITSFAGYAPKIRFARGTTLAEGGERCDFHFFNGRSDRD